MTQGVKQASMELVHNKNNKVLKVRREREREKERERERKQLLGAVRSCDVGVTRLKTCFAIGVLLGNRAKGDKTPTGFSDCQGELWSKASCWYR